MQFSVGYPLNYLREVLNVINDLIQDGNFNIDVKRLRKRSGIKSSNRSMINFYWQTLEFLEEKKIIKRIGCSKPKRYETPKTLIDIEGFFKKI
jgi:predicted transcriptional regulator